MANYYSDTSVECQKRRRAKQIIINNNLDTFPTVDYVEEDLVSIDGDLHKINAGTLTVVIDDKSKSFPILDPNTNEAIIGKSMTYGEAYMVLYSAYFFAAIQRDNP